MQSCLGQRRAAAFKRSAPRVIHTTVTTRQLAAAHGIKLTHDGFCRCPVHGDRDASLKIYDDNKGWYCFGCGKGGDVIAFAMHYFGLDFRQAVLLIDQEFGLGLGGGCASEELVREAEARIAAEQRAEQEREAAAWAATLARRELRRVLARRPNEADLAQDGAAAHPWAARCGQLMGLLNKWEFEYEENQNERRERAWMTNVENSRNTSSPKTTT
jgi:hypothetical protein